MDSSHSRAGQLALGSLPEEGLKQRSATSPLTRTWTQSTESTESNQTIRGSEMPMSPGTFVRTPSFPFPHMSVESGTPNATPGVHMPFTALSPTDQPSRTKLAKGKITKDFMASNAVQSASLAQQFPEQAQADKPNVFDIAVQIQSEVGLVGWWSQTTQVMKESFDVERATLAVPSDSTEIENVPWAQLATFSVDEEEVMSYTTTEPQSATGSLNEILGRENTFGERSREHGSSSNLRSLALKAGANLTSRPKLESRHSYAGYPPKYHSAGPEAFLNMALSGNRPKPTRSGSQALLGGIKTSGEVLRLSAEQLKQHDADGLPRGPMSEDTNLSSNRPSGRVLQRLQPLESDTSPLLTTAGVGRVLNNSSAVVITRKYLDRQSGNMEEDQKKQKPPDKNSLLYYKSHQESSFGLVDGREVSQSLGTKATRPRQPRSSTGSTVKKVSTATKSRGNRREDVSNIPPYEDYEQIQGTPWAQSPAPSPAAVADPEENPFFTTNTSVDDEAFSHHPPLYQYTSGQQIEAIGLDKSSSIIQIALIHPAAALSQPQRIGRLHEDRRAEDHKSGTSRRRLVQQRYSSTERTSKRIPLAILSILAPKTPYPPHLVDCLNQLSPLLATSFYAARQHSNLQSELVAVARLRDRSNVRLSLHHASGGVHRAIGRQPAAVLDRSTTSDSNDSTVESSQMDEYDEQNNDLPQEKYEEQNEAPLEKADRTRLKRKSQEARQGISQDHRDFMVPEQGGRGLRPEARLLRHVRMDEMRAQSDQDARYYAGEREGSASNQSPDILEQDGDDDSIEAPKSPIKHKRQRSHQIKALHSQGTTFHVNDPSLARAPSVSSSSDIYPQTSESSELPREPSMSMLKTMIDNGATQQFIVDPDDGSLIWANSKFQVYRSSSGESIHDQLWNNIYHKDRKAFKKEWTVALQTGEQLSHQVRLRRFDSQYRWFHMKFLPIKDKFGITKYWHGQAMDIHDLHEAEVKAAKSREKSVSEAKYRAIANSLPVIVFAASIPAGMTFANTQWLSYSGQTLDEALGFGFLDHVHPEDLVKCRFPGFEALGSSPRTTELSQSARQPVTQTDSTSAAADSEETGITDKATKVSSRTSYSPSADVPIPNELLRGLAQDGVILCATDGQGNLSITTELRLKSREGEYHWHLVQGCYIESVNFGQGEAQWFIACTDISNQKNTEAKMEQTNAALEVSNAALGKEMQQKMGYLSAMSHEIRTPLNGIIGNLQFLINSGLDDSAAEWAHGAQEAAKGMHELINDILDLSKAEAKMLKLLSHWFNPRSLMEQVIDMLNSKASEKKLELCHECSDDVPKSIRGDSGRIRQVLLNLVGNAVKFTKTGEIVVKCDLLDQIPERVKLSEPTQNEIFVRWTVTDTGSGFTEEDKKLLFKPYSQIKSKNTRDIGGTGLGLTLCKTMVELHGGDITASGQPGIGSVFSFFARFRSRKDSAPHQYVPVAGPPSPPTTAPSAADRGSLGMLANSPALVPSLTGTKSQGSPALMSDSSSALSIRSADYQHSLRSSVSTMDNDMPLKLTLPGSESSDLQSPVSPSSVTPVPKRASTIPLPARSVTLSPKSLPATTKATTAVAKPVLASSTETVTTPTKKASAPVKDALARKSIDLERAKFRPPMLSVLVFCPPEKTRRITCDRIQSVASKSAPCNITSKATVNDTLSLFEDADPVKFTHVVLRSTSDNEVECLVKKLLPILVPLQTCVVIITDQAQVNILKKRAPELDLDGLSKANRIRLILKPPHPHKLAKIFDPFNENTLSADAPKEVKRREQQEQQKRSWEMFGKVLGYKRNRVMAVEDNPVQMKVRALKTTVSAGYAANYI